MGRLCAAGLSLLLIPVLVGVAGTSWAQEIPSTATAEDTDALIVGETPEPGAPLTLEDIQRSVQFHYPLLQAVLLERDARMEAERKALGAFDLGLSATGRLDAVGFYESSGADASLEQQTTLWGARLMAGYRNSRGDYPSYYGDRLTDSKGELRVGATLPLLRGGAIDKARAELGRARIGLESVTPEIVLEQIGMLRDASIAFWRWLAAGRTVEIAHSLLEVAEERQEQIAGRVERGNEPEIDLVDNQRLVVERRGILRGAERDLAQAAIRLSLFLRNDQGEPMLPSTDRMPSVFPQENLPNPQIVERDLELARQSHPILQRLAFQREQL